MNEETKNRITDINNGIIPEGYKKTKVGIVPVGWEIVKLSDIMHNEQRPVEKPKEPYLRIGIRSHAKGTFQELVEKPEEVNMDTLYVVKKDDFIVNITFAWEHAIALASDNDDGKLVSHRFPTYVFDNNSPVYYKYVFCQDLFRQRLELISPGGAGRNRVLNKTDFLNLEIFHPPLPEQQKIAEILSTQDKLIELQERKINQLKTLKKGYLQKMFPKKGSKYPELRFKGFTDAWEQRELRTAATFSKGSGYSKNDLKENGTPIILYGRLYTKYETVISEVDTFVDVQPNSVYSTGHEVIVPASGETAEDISRASFVAKSGILLGGDLNIIVPDDYINPIFLALTISNGNQQKELSKRAQGKSVVHIHNSDLENVVLLYPKYEEQEKIGEYFSKLDTLITLHQRKLDEEKQKKKALMQLLLTGKVRVKL